MTTPSYDHSRAKFFRQSGWMVSATLTAGICMFAVHVIYPVLGDQEYGLFTTLLAMLNVLMIPSLGLQATLAQQSASAVTGADEARLAATVRGVLGWTFGAWLVFALAGLVFRDWIMSTLSIPGPLALVLVALFALCQLWQPMLFGLLQGRQNFLWLGWSQIINGAGRLLMVIVIVLAAKVWLERDPRATQALTGAFCGIAASVLLAGYHTWSAWGHRKRVPLDWRPWLKTVAPLTLGLGAFQLILSVDALVVRTYFGVDQTGNYNAAGTLARGLVIFTSPLALVMFPKIVRSRATGEKSNALLYTLVSVAILGALAAAGCTVMAWFLEYVVAHPDFSPGWLPGNLLAGMRARAEAMRVLGLLIPWFVWCMVPLALGNVLLNNLLAHKRYRVVPFLVLTAAAYVATMMIAASPDAVDAGYSHFTLVIKILGLYNLLFLAVCLVFTWRAPGRPDLAAP